MTTLTVAGEVTSALTHFAQFGLAAIVEAESDGRVTVGWTDTPRPRAFVDCPGLDEAAIARIISAHAGRLADPDSWLNATVDHGGRAGTAAFSPRIKLAASPPEWRELQRTRQEHLDALFDAERDGDLRLIGALGEPAYWREANNGDLRPDHGASRWEMKTRNKGEEFVGNRLLPLAKVVAARSVDDVLAGIIGSSRRDELGKDKQDSRTSTGFTTPGPTESVLAWCALWGISAFPLTHRVTDLSVTPGAFPPGALHTRYMYLPVAVGGVTLARLRSLVVSEQLAVVGTAGLDEDAENEGITALTVAAASKWLFARRVVAVARFAVDKKGSASAPERQVLSGALLPTGETVT